MANLHDCVWWGRCSRQSESMYKSELCFIFKSATITILLTQLGVAWKVQKFPYFQSAISFPKIWGCDKTRRVTTKKTDDLLHNFQHLWRIAFLGRILHVLLIASDCCYSHFWILGGLKWLGYSWGAYTTSFRAWLSETGWHTPVSLGQQPGWRSDCMRIGVAHVGNDDNAAASSFDACICSQKLDGSSKVWGMWEAPREHCGPVFVLGECGKS